MDFALNQRTVSGLDYAGFLDMATSLGCIGVEPRTDLGRPVFDGLPPAEAGRMARDRGLRLLGLSEVYPFDDWTDERRDAVRALIGMAEAAGAETISLIPRVDGGGPNPPDPDFHAAILGKVLELCDGTSVVPLVEPIGFPGCSLRLQRHAAAAIERFGAGGRVGLVHDTFQHALAGDTEMFVPHIRIVHISGFSGTGDLSQDDDGRRVMLDESDRTGAVGQIRALIAAGYGGAFSFETTDPAIPARPDLHEALAASMAHIRAEIDR